MKTPFERLKASYKVVDYSEKEAAFLAAIAASHFRDNREEWQKFLDEEGAA